MNDVIDWLTDVLAKHRTLAESRQLKDPSLWYFPAPGYYNLVDGVSWTTSEQ